jgi:dTMP kinase
MHIYNPNGRSVHVDIQGIFLSFEGIECSGKGEQTKRLLEYLHQNGNRKVRLVREPGGTLYGEALRALLKHPELAFGGIANILAGHEDFPSELNFPNNYQRSSVCELFMFAAARAEFVDKIIAPALKAGEIIIADRFYDSTQAYQGGGRFHSSLSVISTIKQVNTMATQGIAPNLTILIDISVEEMLKRRRAKPDKDAHFEKTCDVEFFNRVRNEYLQIAREEPDRVMVVNGEQFIEDVWQDVLVHVQKVITIN